MKILIIDDDIALGTEVMNILVREGHEAEFVDNAIDAIPLTRSTQYDFVLVDYRMPDFSGKWFVRNAGLPRATKVLLITSYSDRRIIANMFKLGASGYIIKPFDEDELLRHLSFHTTTSARTAAQAS